MTTMLVRQIGRFEVIPKGFGVAWWVPGFDEFVCLPVGIHAVVSIVRSAWIAFRCWHAPDRIADAFVRGEEHAMRRAQRNATESLLAEIDKLNV